jgi:YHS domain-containing protein
MKCAPTLPRRRRCRLRCNPDRPGHRHAAEAPVYTGILNNVAVSGYDPVAYFTDGKPVKGNAKFATNYKGAEFRFASANHLAAFKANPAKYAPQYGGYCAWAVSQGYTASADPSVWKIVGGKLYLNYNQEIGRSGRRTSRASSLRPTRTGQPC